MTGILAAGMVHRAVNLTAQKDEGHFKTQDSTHWKLDDGLSEQDNGLELACLCLTICNLM